MILKIKRTSTSMLGSVVGPVTDCACTSRKSARG